MAYHSSRVDMPYIICELNNSIKKIKYFLFFFVFTSNPVVLSTGSERQVRLGNTDLTTWTLYHLACWQNLRFSIEISFSHSNMEKQTLYMRIVRYKHLPKSVFSNKVLLSIVIKKQLLRFTFLRFFMQNNWIARL